MTAYCTERNMNSDKRAKVQKYWGNENKILITEVVVDGTANIVNIVLSCDREFTDNNNIIKNLVILQVQKCML